ncbi:MAG: magnesium transporter, partial [Clostridia bacterium]|nr:magnesium transporter [Clostridia bacterium]
LLRMRNYYEQLLDITEAVEENENEIFDEARLLIVSNLSKKVVRLREDVDSLSSLISHLQDAYSAYLDLQLNRSMKVFTVMTSIFFPLTVIAGWYGMNFNSMPEFTWKYGYVYVIALSALVSAAVILIGKKKKWY